jgi:dienelactone hydrolase
MCRFVRRQLRSFDDFRAHENKMKHSHNESAFVRYSVLAEAFHVVPSPTLRPRSVSTMHTVEHLKPPTTRIELHSFESLTLTDRQFLTGSSDGKTARIAGELRLPERAARVPAVALLHGSAGLGANVNRWADELNGIGVGAFLVDSFTGRGIVQTVTDQSQLGSLAMIVDAYRALDVLSKHSAIEPSRIAVMGFSKGGFAALYASLKRFQRMYGPAGSEFSAYVPFYPACNTTYLEDEDMTDRPIRIFHGAADNYVPVEPCRKYVRRLGRANVDVQLTEYAGAHHAFDNPRYWPHRSLADAVTTGHCLREERFVGEIINVATGEPFRWNDACVKRGGTVGYDAAATAEATVTVKSFLSETFHQ